MTLFGEKETWLIHARFPGVKGHTQTAVKLAWDTAQSQAAVESSRTNS